MVAFSALLSAVLLAATVNAAPTAHQKRIAQVIADSTTKWVAACTKAGGGGQCNTISQAAFTTLLAAGKNCDQQDAADKMVDLAKTLKNDPDMIRLAQIFVQQPRNAPDSLQVPYCQVAPKNQELNGFFHCQFAGTVKNGAASKFSGDQTGNLPLGVSAVNPPGSCPASKTPVTDGAQLTDTINDPGKPIGGSGTAAAGVKPAVAKQAGAAKKVTARTQAPDFRRLDRRAKFPQNGPAAQKLNDGFAKLNKDSPCTDGQQACVDGGFAQCVGGKFAITQCAGGTQCFALPLVNKVGTSITCTTPADAAARIAA